MRTSSALSTALIVTAAFAVGSSSSVMAQGIKIGKLQRMTAPYIGPVNESYAIGYDGDTVETEEGPSLYSLKGSITPVTDMALIVDDEVSPVYLPKVWFGDCLQCELRGLQASSEIADSYDPSQGQH